MRDVVRPIRFASSPIRKTRPLQLDLQLHLRVRVMAVQLQVQVTKRWLRQVIVALALMCRSSYLFIIEFMRDLRGDRAREGGWPISIGTIHNVLTRPLSRPA
jgi:hypothetical protein